MADLALDSSALENNNKKNFNKKKKDRKKNEDDLATRLRREVAMLRDEFLHSNNTNEVDDNHQSRRRSQTRKSRRGKTREPRRAKKLSEKNPKKYSKSYSRQRNITAPPPSTPDDNSNREKHLHSMTRKLQNQLEQKEDETVRLNHELRAKTMEIRRRERELSMLRGTNRNNNRRKDKRNKRRDFRHERALEESQHLSRTERMALRSRVRTTEEKEAALEYEKQRREYALMKEEEKYLKRKERKARKEAARKKAREERLQELDREYEELWNEALESSHPSAIRSRPSVQKQSIAVMEPQRDSLEKVGTLKVTLMETFLKSINETGQAHLRIVLLPTADSRILSLPPSKAKVEHTPSTVFKYDGNFKTVAPVLRVELHGPGQSSKEQVLLAASSVGIDEAISRDCNSIHQISLNQFGIVKLQVDFTSLVNETPLTLAADKPSRLAVSRQGILRVRVVEAENLKNLNLIMKQDPYVRLTLMPWNVSVTTPVKRNAGTHTRWSPGEATFDLNYPGAPPLGLMPTLALHVMDSEHVVHDRSIGVGSLDLAPFLSTSLTTQRIQVRVSDSMNASAGCITLDIAFSPTHPMPGSPVHCSNITGQVLSPPVPLFDNQYRQPQGVPGQHQIMSPVPAYHRIMSPTSPVAAPTVMQQPLLPPPNAQQQAEFSRHGKLCLRAVYGRELRSVQYLGKQDPYVQFIIPDGDQGKCKTHSNGGSNPEWDASAGLVKLNYAGVKTFESWPTVEIKVFDKETLMSDRLIGQATLTLRILSENKHQHEIHLTHNEKPDAGILVLESWFEEIKTDTHSLGVEIPKLSSEAAKLMCETGTVCCQIASCTQLKNVQMTSKQDPYVRATLLPWKKKSEKTKTLTHGGTNPSWSPKSGSIKLEYPGAPPAGESAQIHFEVMDEESLFSDRLIGEATLIMDEACFHSDKKSLVKQLELKDKAGKDAGVLNFYLSFLPARRVDSAKSDKSKGVSIPEAATSVRATGWHHQVALRAVAIEGENLRSVQTFGKQDPYVRVTHLRSKATAQTKCHDSGGVNPKWDIEKHHSDMRLLLKGAKRHEREDILVEVFDSETVMEDRLIASAQLDLWKDILESPSHETATPMTIRLIDKKGADAGLLMMTLTVFHYEGNEEHVKAAEVKPAKLVSRLFAGLTGGKSKEDGATGSVASSTRSNKRAVTVKDVYVRVMRGRNLPVELVQNKTTSLYCTVTHKRKIRRTGMATDTTDPIWSGDNDRGSMIFPLGEATDISDLKDAVVDLTVCSKRRLFVSTVGNVTINLDSQPYTYIEDINSSEPKATQWYSLNNAPDAQVLVAILLVRKPKKDVEAATRIQASERRRRARTYLEGLRERKYAQIRETAAAHYQRLFRGRMARKEVGKIKEKEAGLASLDKMSMSAIRKAQQRIREDTKAATMIQKHVRGDQTRKKYDMRRVANHIVRIQACVRRFRARRLGKKMLTKIPRGVLTIKCIRAWDLHKAQWIGRQDPFVRFSLEPGHVSMRTKPCTNGGRTPSWESKHANEVVFSMPPKVAGTCADVKMNIEVLDWSTFSKHKLIGKADFSSRLSDLLYENQQIRNKTMEVHLDDANGTLEVEVSWIPESGTVHLLIKIQAVFRRKLEQARYRIKQREHQQAIEIQKRFRGHRERSFKKHENATRGDDRSTYDDKKRFSPTNTSFDEDRAASGLQKLARAKQHDHVERKEPKNIQFPRQRGVAPQVRQPQQAPIRIVEQPHRRIKAVNPANYGNITPETTTRRVRERQVPVHTGEERFSELKHALLSESLDGALLSKLEHRNCLLEKERMEHAASAKAPESFQHPVDIVRVNVLEACHVPSQGLNIHRSGFSCRASVYPARTVLSTKATSTGGQHNPTWSTAQKNVLELGLPAVRDHRDWPVLNLELVRASNIPGYPAKVVGKGSVPLTDQLESHGTSHHVSVRLKDSHGSPAGILKATVSVHLVRIGDVTPFEASSSANPVDDFNSANVSRLEHFAHKAPQFETEEAIKPQVSPTPLQSSRLENFAVQKRSVPRSSVTESSVFSSSSSESESESESDSDDSISTDSSATPVSAN